MAARETVAQSVPLRKSAALRPILPRHGVVTLFGYGITIRVDRGHLILEDGAGSARRHARFARIGHRLDRLIVIGADGAVSLAALQWLADQKASFVMLERDGSVLAVTGPVRPSDARLRRAQACAGQSGLGAQISRELIALKLQGQERVARERLREADTADQIAMLLEDLSTVNSIDAMRTIEARAGAAYWIGWSGVRAQFPAKDIPRIPEHWLTFGTRTSVLTGSPRLAVNPLNAMLNYAYAVLEAETRLAISAMGLDPGLGFVHMDYEKRDSLACDLMEVVRPDVDAYLFDWAARVPFRRDWFFEQRNGNCRLMPDLAAMISETAPRWRQAVGPIVEWLARTLWEHSPKMTGHRPPASRLTQNTKRLAQGSLKLPTLRSAPHQNLCRTCGAPIKHQGIYCRICNAEASKTLYVEAANRGREAAMSPESQARRTETCRRNALAQQGWIAAEHPAWLDQDTYVSRILPRLRELTTSAIASKIQVSLGYADSIRKGKVHPHARHWKALAEIARVIESS